jgi:hypothetical protein
MKKRKKKQTQPTKKLSANFGLFEHLLKFLESKNANPSGYVVKPGAFSRKSPLTFRYYEYKTNYNVTIGLMKKKTYRYLSAGKTGLNA